MKIIFVNLYELDRTLLYIYCSILNVLPYSYIGLRKCFHILVRRICVLRMTFYFPDGGLQISAKSIVYTCRLDQVRLDYDG